MAAVLQRHMERKYRQSVRRFKQGILSIILSGISYWASGHCADYRFRTDFFTRESAESLSLILYFIGFFEMSLFIALISWSLMEASTEEDDKEKITELDKAIDERFCRSNVYIVLLTIYLYISLAFKYNVKLRGCAALGAIIVFILVIINAILLLRNIKRKTKEKNL